MTPFTPTGGDDTAALQAAINGATSLSIEAGNSLISGTLHVDHPREIIMRSGSALRPTHPDCDILSIEAAGVRLVNPRVIATIQRTGGAFIRTVDGLGNDFRLEGGLLRGYWDGLALGDCATLRVASLKCRNGVPGQGAAVVVDGGIDQKIDDLSTNAPTDAQPAAGVRIKRSGDLHISRGAIMHHGANLLVQPGVGHSVNSLWVTDTYLDNAVRGAWFNPAGVIQRCRLSNVWASSMSLQGMLFNPQPGGVIDGVEIDGAHAFLSAHNGIQVQGNTRNIQIRGGSMAGNTLSGIAIGSGASHIAVQNTRSGDSNGCGPNGGWGCIVYASGQEKLRITGNDFTGNGTGSLKDSSGAVTKIVENNLV